MSTESLSHTAAKGLITGATTTLGSVVVGRYGPRLLNEMDKKVIAYCPCDKIYNGTATVVNDTATIVQEYPRTYASVAITYVAAGAAVGGPIGALVGLASVAGGAVLGAAFRK